MDRQVGSLFYERIALSRNKAAILEKAEEPEQGDAITPEEVSVWSWPSLCLERSAMADKLAGQYVEVNDFSDRPLEVRWKGRSLPYRVFSKDQRVSHTAIIEIKRLSHALTTVKTQQDIKHLPKIITNSDKGATRKGRARSTGQTTRK